MLELEGDSVGFFDLAADQLDQRGQQCRRQVVDAEIPGVLQRLKRGALARARQASDYYEANVVDLSLLSGEPAIKGLLDRNRRVVPL